MRYERLKRIRRRATAIDYPKWLPCSDSGLTEDTEKAAEGIRPWLCWITKRRHGVYVFVANVQTQVSRKRKASERCSRRGMQSIADNNDSQTVSRACLDAVKICTLNVEVQVGFWKTKLILVSWVFAPGQLFSRQDPLECGQQQQEISRPGHFQSPGATP